MKLSDRSDISNTPVATDSSTATTTTTTLDTATVIQHLYENTYSEVGDNFLQCLVKEISVWTGAQTVMIHRLLTLKEFEDLKGNEGCPSIELVGKNQTRTLLNRSGSGDSVDSGDSSHGASTPETTPPVATTHHRKNSLEYMLVKASYTTLKEPCPAFARFSATPFSLFSPDSPQLQTVKAKYPDYHVTHDTAFMDDAVYPEYRSFIGIRLNEANLPIGLITVMDDKRFDDERIDSITKILLAVKNRTKNEIQSIRVRDRLVITKNDALQDAESKLKFLADMSHEIRTPMNAVIALTDLLLQERGSLNEEQTGHLEVIQTSGNHLLTVINDILDISKINHDPKFKLEARRFSLRKCVKDALNMARHQASMTQHSKLVRVAECPAEMDDNIPLNQLVQQLETSDLLATKRHTHKTVLPLLWKIDYDVPDYLMGDSMRLTQIILNLCSNAVKFTRSGGIRVKITRYIPPDPQNAAVADSKFLMFKQRYDAKMENIYASVMKQRGRPNNSDSENSNNKTTNTNNNNDTNSAGTITNNNSTNSVDDYDCDNQSITAEEEEDIAEKVVLEISVTDTGIGIPADRLPKLFKSFSQIDISTARRYGGTGLGLAISSMLVNIMGGGLWVESEDGLGSRFAFMLPLSVATSRPSVGSSSTGCDRESESSAYTSSSMIASPSSPGSSSVSDGGSSVGDRTTTNDSNSIEAPYSPSSPSSSIGYFPLQQYTTTTTQNNSNSNSKSPLTNNNNSPWEALNIPCLSSPTSMQPSATDIHYTNDTKNTNAGGHNTVNDNSLNILSSNTNNNKELQNMISKNKNSQISNTCETSIVNNQLQTLEVPPKATRSSRTGVSKHKKSSSHTHEENLALQHPIHILLAEDNVLNQKIAVSILKRLGYQDVVIASNGREVLELMRAHKFDVIFMDLYMPEMDGLEATRYIISEREHNVPPPPPTAAIEAKTPLPLINADDVYIIALTASASKQDRQICIDMGMNDFIGKPFTMMEMQSALKNCASKRKKRRKQQHLLYEEELQQQRQKDDDPLLVAYKKEEPVIGDQIVHEEQKERTQDESVVPLLQNPTITKTIPSPYDSS